MSSKSLENERILEEVIRELEEESSTQDWDLCKLNIQSIIRAFRRPKPPEKKIETLHKKITNCAIRVAKNPSDEVASHKLESFRIQLKEELEKMSENWCRRSKAKWIEEGECSTKYFYAQYKARKSISSRKSISCQDKIKPPKNGHHERDTLCHIRDFSMKLKRSTWQQ
ncbi:hypothetical protein C2G38_2102193 [Gigaspora rosea]|uniref:Uncharacterized protein n=1 Tax=Gigaspora rosea TaxID=44941 RepID=A0A397UWN8_9GLOM|nr:hypothetical protein C2G38_2102193 [Gigaspora rosea]